MPESDEHLKAEILKSGYIVNDKLYVVSEKTKRELNKIICEIANTGATIIYYNLHIH